jgi:GntR family transcriptional regulator, arabinose operon transcriptional repressor
MATSKSNRNLYFNIINELEDKITRGKYSIGYQLPTESELAARYKVSRPTIAKAYNSLKNSGLVEKRVGAGTFVIYRKGLSNLLKIGILFPGPGESEIFESILIQISKIAPEKNIKIIWDGAMVNDAFLRGKQIKEICENYIRDGVKGVLFSPLERIPGKDAINKSIYDMFSEKNIPVVLIDRDIVSFPQRSNCDLVGIDNISASFEVTSHLIKQGCNSVYFLHRPDSAPTIDLRIQGFQSAVMYSGNLFSSRPIIESEPDVPENLLFLKKVKKPCGIVCANDATAAVLLTTLKEMGTNVPEKVKVASFDDMKYARHLRVPLTTYRQPTSDIAKAAIDALLNRLLSPGMAPVTISIKGKLIKRESTY